MFKSIFSKIKHEIAVIGGVIVVYAAAHTDALRSLVPADKAGWVAAGIAVASAIVKLAAS